MEWWSPVEYVRGDNRKLARAWKHVHWWQRSNWWVQLNSNTWFSTPDTKCLIGASDLCTPVRHMRGNNKPISFSAKLKNNGPVVVTSDHRSNTCRSKSHALICFELMLLVWTQGHVSALTCTKSLQQVELFMTTIALYQLDKNWHLWSLENAVHKQNNSHQSSSTMLSCDEH